MKVHKPPLKGDCLANTGQIVVTNILQIALAVMFSFFANLFGYFPETIASFLAYRQRRNKMRGKKMRKDGDSTITRLMKAIRTSRPAEALFSSLTEFQETQAYLLIAFQIATLVSYATSWKPVDFFNVRSSSFYVTVQSLPVLLIQSTLQRAGMRWWYMYCLTVAVHVLAITVD